MSLKWKALLVVAVFAGGFATAMFFRKDGDPPVADPPSPEVAVTPARDPLRAVPLRMSAEPAVSPAAELAPLPSQKPELPPIGTPLFQPLKSDLDAPPEIGSQYVPLSDPFRSAADGVPTLPPPTSPFRDPSLVPVGSSPGSGGMTVRRYKLRDGDTLAKLAQKYLGDPARAKEIYEANRVVLASPDILPLGVEIVLPGVPVTDD